MKKYQYNEKEYDSLYQLRKDNRNLVFSTSAPEEVLNAIGITVLNLPDPEPVPPPEETEEEKLQRAKERRNLEVSRITVIVDGMEFDGNEQAQRRMSAALDSWPKNIETVDWVLHDDSVHAVTYSQLEEAFNMAVQKMLSIWTAPYTELENETEEPGDTAEQP